MRKFAIATDINNRIKEVRQRFGLTQKEFSEEIGISRSYLSEIEASKAKPSIETLTGILLHYEVDSRWLLIGEMAGEASAEWAAEDPAPYKAARKGQSGIPLLDSKTIAGPPRPIGSKDIVGYVPLPEEFPSIKRAYCFYARDDGMAPLLPQGALIGVSPLSGSLKKGNEKIIAAWLSEGGLTVRRLRFDKKYLILEPENRNYSPLYIERSAQITLFYVDWWRQRQ